MYVSNMTHFLDEEGKISPKAPKEARELASFLMLVIDSYTQKYTDDKQEVRCFTENCRGIVNIGRSILHDEILWDCPECNISGNVSEWRGTAGENSGTPTIESKENEIIALDWVKKLTDQLKFPVVVIPESLVDPGSAKVENWVMTRITDYVEIYGLVVEIEDGIGTYRFPVCELTVKDEQSTNYKLIEEFLDWWYTHHEDIE